MKGILKMGKIATYYGLTEASRSSFMIFDKELEKYNEKVAIEKYGKDGSSSGAVLGDILGKVFKSKKKKEKK